ncbi:MAG TPA: homogentisate 1,2-dioxygenase [Flavobacteriales bacterium]|nr:homogentisate 1,2-dioxygenase [Flavobacteriales bacterium]|tara:strand:- start:5087 stop:6259 length:1173 start_codon:yes stop_codon:yes gene_type:complete
MPFYHTLGTVPKKRHTQFRKEDKTLHHEQLFGTIGFVGMSSLLYHHHRPTMVKRVVASRDVQPKAAIRNNLLSRKLEGFKVNPIADYLESRTAILFNSDVTIHLAAPTSSMDTEVFFKNADGDEVVFVHEGAGTLHTMLGKLPFKPGDYIVIPRGIIHRFAFDGPNNRLFITESAHPVHTPKRYRNHFGQHLEHSPYCERDIHPPTELETIDTIGEFPIHIKKQGSIHEYIYAAHPFDVVGWDGYHFPYTISIHDFEPITGRVHQPPPVHQMFETDAFVICSFVPRFYDYHPLSIPAPYNHSNIDSDEVLYYVEGDFMSRTGIDRGYISLHPSGIPHGPHPGTYEGSIGKTKTDELAVMVDTFRPLQVTEAALAIEHNDYHQSWLEPGVK